MMNAKNFLTKTFLLATLIVMAIFTSCKIGLGAAVDTLAPTVSISTPSANDIKSGEFEITGIATDDRGLRDVAVYLVENGVTKYEYVATIDASTNKWSVVVPTLNSDKTSAVVDAKYEIKVVATDKDGKSSVATRAVQIDNTAPTVLLTSPSLFDENKSTFFRQLRISGSCYDVSEIKSVKVYFYKDGETSTDLNDTSKYKVFQAEGTNTWELSKDIEADDKFFANNVVYNFFVVAEDITGNKNTYFYRMGDFYSKGILVDANPDDGDDYIPFPSMMQIGKFDQGDTVESPTSGLTAAKLFTIKTQCKSIEANNSNFLYRSESASNISWGNIEYDGIEPKAIPLKTDITGQIKSTDGTDILPDSIEVYLRSETQVNSLWKIPTEIITLDISGKTVAFTIPLKIEKDGNYVKSGNYNIQIKYKTVASINSELLESNKQKFAISAGLPSISERQLSADYLGNETSPISLQVYSNKDKVKLGGEAILGDGTPANTGEFKNVFYVKVNDEAEFYPEVSEEEGHEGFWSYELTEEGTYTVDLTIRSGQTASISRTVIIDRTVPNIENPSFAQDATKTKVSITAFVTDENALEKIEYAFVSGSVEAIDDTAAQWKPAQNKSSVNETLTNDENAEFTQGPWTLFIRATDKAGNVIVKKVDGVLDQDAPVFTNEAELKAKLAPETGYLNTGFSFDSLEYSGDTVIAEDNQKIAKISVSAKRNGVVEKDYTDEKTIDKKELQKKDLVDLLSIPKDKEGKWIVSLQIEDENGNKSELTVDFIIDVTKPTIAIETVPQAKNNSSSPFEFKGSANDDVSSVSKIYISLDKDLPLDKWTKIEGQKSWSSALDIENEGDGTIYAYAVDGAGNESDVVKADFTFDKSFPTIELETEKSFYSNTNFEIKGTAKDGWKLKEENPIKITQYKKAGDDLVEKVELGKENGLVIDISEDKKSSTWKIGDLPRNVDGNKIEKDDIPTATYVYIIEVTDETDEPGKTTKEEVTVSIDRTPPEVEFSNLDDNAKLESSPTTVKGSVEDDSTPVSISWKLVGSNQEGNFKTKGNWQIPLEPLDSGIYTLSISASDTRGNPTKKEINFTVDKENPRVETSLEDEKANSEYNSVAYTLSGIAKDNLALAKIEVTATKNNIEVPNWSEIYITKNSDKEWAWSGNLAIDKEHEGQWKFSIKAVDSVGRESLIQTRSVLVDVTPPVFKSHEITTDYVNGNGKTYYKNKTINIKGVLEEFTSGIQKVEYSTDNGETWTSCYSTNESFEATVSLENTDTIVKFRATDVAGNVSDYETEVINIDVDNPIIEAIINPEGTLLLNGEEDLPIEVQVSDKGSGVKSVSAKLGSKQISTESINVDGTAQLSFEAADIKSFDSTSGFVVIEVEDYVGNKSSTSFSFEKDSEAPTVEITSHEPNTEVNKTIILAGTTKESQGLKLVELFVDGDSTAIKSFEGNAGFNWSYNLDTETYYSGKDTKPLKISVVATDNAGNTDTEEITLIINQKSDRPVITINNVPLKDGYLVGQTYVFGSIYDDDGNIETLEISSGNATSFQSVPVNNGGFVYIINEADGNKTLYFRVKDKGIVKDTDKVGTEFTTTLSSTDDALLEPILEYTPTEGEKQTSNAPLTFNLDTIPPAVGEPRIQIKGETDSEPLSNNMEVGGNKKQFTIFTNPSDGNGIKNVFLTIQDNDSTVETITATQVADSTDWKMEVDTNDIELANLQFTINVEDNAGSKSSLSRNILVDNTPPTFNVESHNEGDKVTGIVKLIGTTSDDTEFATGSGIKSIQWLITEKTNNVEDESLEWHDVHGTLSWNHQFEGIYELSKFVVGENVDKYADEVEAGSNVWALPIYFKITDDVGNYSIESFTLNVDPDGDRPTAKITYPESAESNEDALGGTIRIFGTAEDNVAVAGVQMQIDYDGDGDFEDDDRAALAGLKDRDQNTIYSIKDKDGEGNPVDWHILVDGKTSWNMTINSDGEFDPTGTDDTNTINVRVRAIDNNGKLGIWSSSVQIIIDKNAPRIGSTNPLRLVQYGNDGKEKSSIPYTPDMWVKGDWYLVGSVQDESGIKEFKLDAASDTDITLSTSDIILGDVVTFEGNQTGYNFKIHLNTTNAPGSKVAFSLEALDNSDAKANIDISIKYDNAAPTVNTLKHGDLAIGDGNNDTTVITQSNNAYGIESAVTESGSGFSKLAIFFKRTLNGQTYIYNPAISKEKDGNKVTVGSSLVLAKDELPRLVIEKANRPSDEEIQDDSLKNNENIRKGGLVRIGGMERQITSVDYSEGKVTFTPPASKDDYKKAEFAYALVVDNFKVENTTEYDDYGNPITISNDDGDMVVESVERNGATYDWTLSINSKNIADGPIEVCYMAYDEAGNCSTLTTISTSVQNQRPAIAKVWLGTDLNGDGKISEQEEVEYRSNFTSKTAEYEVTLDTSKEELFTAKAKSSIRPEIVGGNNELYYYIKNIVSDENKVELKREGDLDKRSIILNVDGNTLEGEADTDKNNPTRTFTYQIWDSTEGLITGKTSQWTKIVVKMAVDVVDDVEPEIKINPLSWVSKSENSLYQNSSANGHIDLSDDLPDTFKEKDGGTVVTGVMDRDDKVSGKITFTGTAYDNVRLGSLSFTFDRFDVGNNSNKITFNNTNNSWSSVGTMATEGYTGYEFTAETVTLDQGGHQVNWTLSIDTAKINGVAAADVSLNVEAKDHVSNSGSDSKQVDVVPYIIGLETWLKGELKTSIRDAYSRTALGHYIINESEDTITLTGFNLGTQTTVSPSTAKTGAFSVKVNGIESLNNMNNNNAKGSYEGTITEESSYEIKNNYAYNRLANGRTNNLLTDDIFFDVWEFDSEAAVPESGKLSEPIMKINPVTGKVGFAFVSGPAHFAMGNGTTNSYQTFQRNYATFSNISFAYDDNGNSYGTATGLDTYPNGNTNTFAGRFTFITSQWGIDIDSMDDNYNGDKKIRFEAIGLPGNDECYVKGVYPDTYTMTETRFASPSMAVTTHGNNATVYLAYYDDVQDQIRFRYGTVSSGKADFGDFVDNDGLGDVSKNGTGDSRKYVFESYTNNFSLIAGVDWQKYDTTGKGIGYTKNVGDNYFYDTGYEADAYVAIDVVKGTSAANDVVVAVWYDGKDCYYAYNTKPQEEKDNGIEGGWTTKKIFSDGGEYCTVKVDSSKGIHIAANVDGSLKYAYLSSYNAEYDESTQAIKIDSCAITGEQITIDVGKKTIDNITYEIPYISYYMSASKKPCIAYITENAISSNGTINYAAAGTDENDCFTGNWEVSVIPTKTQLSGGHSDKINVGLWKNTDGSIKNSTSDTNVTGTGSTGGWNSVSYGYGDIYGNGTANPIFGYAVRASSGTCIETAQLK